MGAMHSHALSSTTTRSSTRRSSRASPTLFCLYCTAIDAWRESDAAERQLDTQCFFVDEFQKARAEMPMHFDRCSDHAMGKAIERCARFLSPNFPGDLGVLAA